MPFPLWVPAPVGALQSLSILPNPPEKGGSQTAQSPCFRGIEGDLRRMNHEPRLLKLILRVAH